MAARVKRKRAIKSAKFKTQPLGLGKYAMTGGLIGSFVAAVQNAPAISLDALKDYYGSFLKLPPNPVEIINQAKDLVTSVASAQVLDSFLLFVPAGMAIGAGAYAMSPYARGQLKAPTRSKELVTRLAVGVVTSVVALAVFLGSDIIDFADNPLTEKFWDQRSFIMSAGFFVGAIFTNYVYKLAMLPILALFDTSWFAARFAMNDKGRSTLVSNFMKAAEKNIMQFIGASIDYVLIGGGMVLGTMAGLSIADVDMNPTGLMQNFGDSNVSNALEIAAAPLDYATYNFRVLIGSIADFLNGDPSTVSKVTGFFKGLFVENYEWSDRTPILGLSGLGLTAGWLASTKVNTLLNLQKYEKMRFKTVPISGAPRFG